MNNELGLFEKKNKVYVSSRIIAEKFQKRHDSVVSILENLILDSREYPFGMETPEFNEQKYINSQNGQGYKEYLINKRAFILLMMRLKAYQFAKLTYLNVS